MGAPEIPCTTSEHRELRLRLLYRLHRMINSELAEAVSEAMALADAGKNDAAEKPLRMSLEVTEAEFGEDGIEVGICLQNLGRLYRRTGRIDEAIPICERAI